jgi:uncharacterized repeat protein (TIGR01451 family)
VGTSTVLTTTAYAGNWSHRWFDLSLWSGRVITLTFNVHQTAGYAPAWAYLDEITLGSAYADTWVRKAGPERALPGGPLAYTIEYGNRGGVPASGVRITDTLPAEIESWAATPYPDLVAAPLLAWEIGDLGADSAPGQIEITATVRPEVVCFQVFTNTAQIAATSPELEVGNNLARAGTLPVYSLYLPLVTR